MGWTASPSGSDGDCARLGRHCYSRPYDSPSASARRSLLDRRGHAAGPSVDECVRRLKRLHYAFKRLHGIFNARITAEPLYELKSAFSYHAYLCAEHVSALRQRVGEMREPPLGLEEVPHPALEQFFDEILAAPATGALVAGLYGRALPAIAAALDRYDADTHPLADAPSRRVCRFARLEVGDMLDFRRARASRRAAGRR